eukprot:1287333-Pleurochrysis_carterae.AAC.1
MHRRSCRTRLTCRWQSYVGRPCPQIYAFALVHALAFACILVIAFAFAFTLALALAFALAFA